MKLQKNTIADRNTRFGSPRIPQAERREDRVADRHGELGFQRAPQDRAEVEDVVGDFVVDEADLRVCEVCDPTADLG